MTWKVRIGILSKKASAKPHVNDTGLKDAITAFREEKMNGLYSMPTLSMLKDAGRLDMVAGIKHHGGFQKIAMLTGLKMIRGAKVCRARESDVEWLGRQLAAFGDVFGRMPTSRELLDNGRIDIVRSIQQHGGRDAVSKRFGLDCEHDSTLLSEDFMELEICGDVAVLDNSTLGAHAGETTGRRPPHFYKDFERVKADLQSFILANGDVGVMPTAKQLMASGRGDLMRAIKLHGGHKTVAKKLQLVVYSDGKSKVRKRSGRLPN